MKKAGVETRIVAKIKIPSKKWRVHSTQLWNVLELKLTMRELKTEFN
jgi:hypothetical protein